MKILAIEQSTNICSVALLEDTGVIGEKQWTQEQPRGHMLFNILPEFLNSLSAKLNDINLFASGIGPGSFSGLRIACTAVNSFALPGKTKVMGIPSVNALAYEIFNETKAKIVTVLGDARRDHFWAARFESIDQTTVKPSILLVPYKNLKSEITTDSVVVSPDFDRFSDMLNQASNESSTRLITVTRVPKASAVGKLAFLCRDTDSPAHPIYLHPAAGRRAEEKSINGKISC